MSLDEDLFKWSLRLFISVDLEGSTAYKFSGKKDGVNWQQAFEEFYKEFPNLLEGCYIDLPGNLPKVGSKMLLWKFNGDEILFQTDLCDNKEAAAHVLALRKALFQFNRGPENKKLAMRCKATAWIAGFPVNNSMIEVSREIRKEESEKVVDFIGPSIDLGFRLSKFASSRKMAISIELIYLLLDTLDKLPNEEMKKIKKDYRFYFEGRQELKGVMGGAPYPIVWLDVLEEAPVEDELLNLKPIPPDDDKLKQFCRFFICKEDGAHLPFIINGEQPIYGELPQSFVDKRNRLVGEFKMKKTKEVSEIKELPENEQTDATEKSNEIISLLLKLPNLDAENSKDCSIPNENS